MSEISGKTQELGHRQDGGETRSITKELRNWLRDIVFAALTAVLIVVFVVQPVKVEGIIISDIQRRKAGNAKRSTFTLGLIRIQTNWGWKSRKGKILVNLATENLG